MFYMFLADGFEETEALVTLDMLRRAKIDIQTVGIGDSEIRGAHGIIVKSDICENDCLTEATDGIILPGGMPGTENLYNSAIVSAAVDFCIRENKFIGAICAAPVILGRKGYLNGKKAVCFPGFENELIGSEYTDMPCVVDDNIITAKGAGCVFEFSYEIIKHIKNSHIANSVIQTVQHIGF